MTKSAQIHSYIFPRQMSDFYLLVVISYIVPSLWALIFGSIIFSIMIGAPINFVPLLIYLNYQRFPRKIMNESKLNVFNKQKFPSHCKYIENIYEDYLLKEKTPKQYIHFQKAKPSIIAESFIGNVKVM